MGRPEITASAPGAIAVSGDVQSVSSNVTTQVVSGSQFPVQRAAMDPGKFFSSTRVETFTGRKWLADDVERFMAAHTCGYMFIEAEAGLGKTAFAAWLVKTRGYLSHFSGYSGGRTVRGCLQNLSAQLIMEFGLDGEAPHGMLPDWPQTPGGFDQLLTIAARRARDDKRQLVLVVDGLDEAEPSSEQLPFGLPSLLPDGVYVIGTYRTGRSPRSPQSPAETFKIVAQDPSNLADIREYLDAATSEPLLAGVLVKTGADPQQFAAALGGRCGGMWLYLRYVLEEVRIGKRNPDAVNELPSRLRDYYADQLREWRSEPAWQTGLLPLAATLAVAGEPVTADTLARLAGDLDRAAVRGWCDYTLRPMLTATQSASSAPVRYEIYHVSFREVLKAVHDVPPGRRQPYGETALSGELREAAQGAHNRIADIYLDLFGGLAEELPALGGDPDAAQIDDGYPLRHLARHLQHAGREDDLDALLSASHRTADHRALNIWFTAHDRANCLARYLEDLTRAREASAAATDKAIALGQPAPTLGTEIRYALMTASVASLSASLPADLLDQLIDAGVWSADRALDHARRLKDASARISALLAVCRHSDSEMGCVVVGEALNEAKEIHDSYASIKALTELVPHLPDDKRMSAVSEALAGVGAIDDADSRASALAGLAPYLTDIQRPDVLNQMLAAVAAIDDDDRWARTLTALAPCLPADERLDVLCRALATADARRNDSRTDALTELALYLPEEHLAEPLAAAMNKRSGDAAALVRLAPYLSARQQAQALAAAIAIKHDDSRAEALTGLAPHLPATNKLRVLAAALDAAATIEHPWYKAEALTRLAPHVPDKLLAQALDITAALNDSYYQAKVLIALAPRLTAEQMSSTLKIIPLRDEDQVRALAALAPRLPATERPAVLARAVAAASAIGDDAMQARALSALALRLPEPGRTDVLARALSTATSISDDDERTEALTALADLLPEDQLTVALAAADRASDDSVRVQALSALALRLPEPGRTDVLARALSTATSISDKYQRAEALTALARHLPAAEWPGLLSTVAATSDDYDQMDIITRLAPHIPEPEWPSALAAAAGIKDEYWRTAALTRLLPHVPPGHLPAVITNISAVVQTEPLSKLIPHFSAKLIADTAAAAAVLEDEDQRASALAGLASQLPSGQQVGVEAQTLLAAAVIGDDGLRAGALAGLAPRLPENLWPDVLAAAAVLEDEDQRASALAGLASQLPSGQHVGVEAQTLLAAAVISDDGLRAGALAGLAPRLPENLWPDVLAAAAVLEDEDQRASALAGLAAHLPEELQDEVLAAIPARCLSSPITLKALCQIPAWTSHAHGSLVNLLREALDPANRHACLEVIEAAAPAIPEAGGEHAIMQCVEAVLDTCQWWP